MAAEAPGGVANFGVLEAFESKDHADVSIRPKVGSAHWSEFF
ncbi:MAG: hypothetical protein VX822_05060 [Candidatus Neomarinimicrobiota bacterium]|nr:hypothetical protein [Candidatus Neomarinimicrobiota bacterium]